MRKLIQIAPAVALLSSAAFAAELSPERVVLSRLEEAALPADSHIEHSEEAVRPDGRR